MPSNTILTFLLISAAIFHQIQSLRVLVAAPNILYSHLALHIAIADLLVEEGGHEVTLLIPVMNPNTDFPPKEHTNWTRSQRVIQYTTSGENLQKLRHFQRVSPFSQESMWESEMEFMNKETMNLFLDTSDAMCKAMFADPELLASLEAAHFDVAIAEWFDGCHFPLFHRLNIRATITTSAIPMDSTVAKILGIPTPVYFPEVNSAPPSGTEMGILDRARTFYRRLDNTMDEFFAVRPFLVDLMGPEFPSHRQLLRRSSFLLVNTNEYLDLTRPISAKIKHIGGFTLKKEKAMARQLDARTESVLAASEKGAVLVSFGSVADPRQMPARMFAAFLDAFAAFPRHTFIWKFIEDEEREDGKKNGSAAHKFPANVHTFGWLNQRAILASPKVRLFISHCGLNSLNEAAFEGVPLLCVPIFGDQNYNAAIVNQRRAGRVLLKSQLNGANLKEALGQLLADNDNQYAQNMRTVGRKMARAPFQPADIILRHVQFAAEFGGAFDELNLEGANMDALSLAGMDFLLPLALLAALALAILAKSILLLVRHMPRHYFHLAIDVWMYFGGKGKAE